MKHLFSVGTPLVLLGLFALSTWYVSAQLSTLLGLSARWLIPVLVIGGAVAALGAARFSSAFVGALNVLGGYLLIFYFFLLLLLLLLHALQLKWNLPPAWSAGAALLLAFVLTGAGALWATTFRVKQTEIRLPKLKHEVTVMHISDVHLGHRYGRSYLARIVEETNRHKPDLVLITGDLIDSNAALKPGVLEPLSGFAAPVYFVGGNHEKYIDAAHAFELLTQQGVRVLRNEVVETHGLQLVGLDYMNADEDSFDMHPSDDLRTLKSVLPGLALKKELPSVLMHHSPVGVRYAAAAGVDLMVSGHTHAGQVFPVTLLANILFPFNRGLYQQDGLQVFVSPGVGTFLAHVRLGTSNEIHLLRLVPGK